MEKKNMNIPCKKIGAVVLGLWLVILIYILMEDVFKSKELHADDGSSKSGGKHHRHMVEKYPQGDVVHVCLGTDEDTVLGLVATINSVWQGTRHPVEFHIVANPAADAILKRWLEQTSLNVLDYEVVVFDETTLKDRIAVHGGREELAKPMSYARYFYTELFPKLHGKVIHLDCDVIVQGDIMELYHTSISPDQLAAASEDCHAMSKRFSLVPNAYSSYLNFEHSALREAGIDPAECSFNAGVLLLDLDTWRNHNMTHRLMHWVDLNAKENVYGSARGGGGSQPPLMIELYKKYANIDPMWHVRHLGLTASQRYSTHFINHAKLLHWNGHFKPWKGIAQFTNIWDKYYIEDPTGKLHPNRKLKKSLLPKQKVDRL